VSDLDILWLLLAGFGAGIAGSVAGLASLVSYPTLLAVGVAPVAANVTNTISLVFSAVGSLWGMRPELAEQSQMARRLGPLALAGGISGSVLLLVTPAGDFTKIVPVLIGAGSFAVLVPRRPVAAGELRRARPFFSAGVYLVTLYCGYFGAGSGVVLLALLMAGTGLSLVKCVALRNLLVGLANAVAAVSFAVFGPVHWLAVLPLAAGFLVGGRLGPLVVRRAPVWPMRVLIACAGIGLAVHLGLGAY
jgi:uncharacterized protein